MRKWHREHLEETARESGVILGILRKSVAPLCYILSNAVNRLIEGSSNRHNASIESLITVRMSICKRSMPDIGSELCGLDRGNNDAIGDCVRRLV